MEDDQLPGQVGDALDSNDGDFKTRAAALATASRVNAQEDSESRDSSSNGGGGLSGSRGRNATDESPSQQDAAAAAAADQAMTSPGNNQSLPNGATGPASSGSTSPASSSTTSTSASSHLPLPPLPLEVFHRVMRFLEPNDVVTFRRVSSLWYNAINSEPRLWREITCSLVDDLEDQLALYSKYARPRATGQSGGITRLDIVLEGVRSANHGHLVDIVPLEHVVQALEQVINSLAEFSIMAIKPDRGPLARRGGVRYQSSLRSLRIRLEPQSQVPAWVLHLLSRYRSHALFCQLESLDIYANIPNLPLGEHFLSMFPRLSRLTVRGAPYRPTAFAPWTWSHEDVDADLEPLRNLRELVLRDVRIAGETAIPPLPALARFSAHNTCWENRSYYLLIRIARKTLERIELHSLLVKDLDEPDVDFHEYLDIRDTALLDPLPPGFQNDDMFSTPPLPICLPRLRRLHVTGISPAIWAPEYGSDDPSEYVNLPTPFLVMPNLEECDLTEIGLDAIEELEPAIGPLSVLGKLAPNMRSLCLHGVITDDLAIHACFYEMHGRLTHLDLSESSTSDQIICRLPGLTPMLRELDVRGCPEISVQGVARMVEVIRRYHDEGQSKVERVWIDAPSDASWAEFQAYDWLAFVDVLQRDEFDYEGEGPDDPKQRRKWIRLGKLDSMHEYKAKYAEWEHAQAAKRAIEERRAAGSSSSRVAAAAAGGGLGLLQQAAAALPASLIRTIAGSGLSMAPSAPIQAPAAAAAAVVSPQTSFPVQAFAVATPAAQQAPLANASGPPQSPAPLVQAPAQPSANPTQLPGTAVAGSVTSQATLGSQTLAQPASQDGATPPPSVQHSATAPTRHALSNVAPFVTPSGALHQPQVFAQMQPHSFPPPPRSGFPPAPPTVPRTTAISPSKRKIDAESLDFDVANVDAAFVAAQAREMERLEQAQAVRLQAQVDQASDRARGGGGGGGGTARAKLQKIYQEQQQQQQQERPFRGADASLQPEGMGDLAADDDEEDDNGAVPAWKVLNAELADEDEDEPVAEVIVSDEEPAASATTIAPVAAPVYGFAAGESSDDDDEELKIETINATAVDEDASEEPFVPLV